MNSNPRKPSIPDYTLVSIVGQGSFGEVWMAVDATGNYCALKVVHRKESNQRVFIKEFEGLKTYLPISRVHPNLITILHVGIARGNEYYYYTMELADNLFGHGFDEKSYQPLCLSSKINSIGELACIDEFCTIANSLASAVSFLHSNNLVHRDIKPSNIIFVGGQAKLADIGLIAKISEAKTFVGSHGYIPPEGPGKPTADIYSLGKCLYELLYNQKVEKFPELPTAIINNKSRFKEYSVLNQLLTKLCDPNPLTRIPSGEQLVNELKKISRLNSKSFISHERKIGNNAFKTPIVVLLLILLFSAYFYFILYKKRIIELTPGTRVSQSEQQDEKKVIRSSDFIQGQPINKTKISERISQSLEESKFASQPPANQGMKNNQSLPRGTKPIAGNLELSKLKVLDPNVSSKPRFSFSISTDLASEKNGEFKQSRSFFIWDQLNLEMLDVPNLNDFLNKQENFYDIAWVSATEVTRYQYTFATNYPDTKPIKDDKLPIANISWNEASSFCEKLTSIALENNFMSSHFKFSLLPEKLWEYCCKSDSDSSYAFGDLITSRHANIGRQSNSPFTTNLSHKKSLPVRSYKPNSWGFYDMHGNVAEWTLDTFRSSGLEQSSASRNKIIKGGSYRSSAEQSKIHSKNHFSPEFKSDGIGIRIALFRFKN